MHCTLAYLAGSFFNFFKQRPKLKMQLTIGHGLIKIRCYGFNVRRHRENVRDALKVLKSCFQKGPNLGHTSHCNNARVWEMAWKREKKKNFPRGKMKNDTTLWGGSGGGELGGWGGGVVCASIEFEQSLQKWIVNDTAWCLRQVKTFSFLKFACQAIF